MSYAGKIKINNVDYPIAASLYGECATTGATAAKVVTLANFDALVDGVTIAIKFRYANAAASPTLNVNATGAKAIRTSNNGTPGITASTSWEAGSVVALVYVEGDDAWTIVGSVSGAIANLEASISSEVNRATTVEANLTATVTAAIESLTSGKEPKKLQFTDVVVETAAFVADTTYTDFGYRAAIALTGVTASMIPWVAFSGNDASSGDYSTTADTYDGGVYIYADKVPDAAITIPTIVCFSGEST